MKIVYFPNPSYIKNYCRLSLNLSYKDVMKVYKANTREEANSEDEKLFELETKIKELNDKINSIAGNDKNVNNELNKIYSRLSIYKEKIKKIEEKLYNLIKE